LLFAADEKQPRMVNSAMTILTRIVAAAALVSIALADIAGASAAENYNLAAQRARALSHHERASIVKAASGEAKKRGMQKRCKTATTSTSLSDTHTRPHPDHTPSTSYTTTTVTPTNPETTPTKPSSSGGKKGLAWSGTNDELPAFVNNNVQYIYNWGATPPQEDGLKAASMLWGYKDLDEFRQNRDNYDYLMGPNECVLQPPPLPLYLSRRLNRGVIIIQVQP
jgi:hypothetical protein